MRIVYYLVDKYGRKIIPKGTDNNISQNANSDPGQAVTVTQPMQMEAPAAPTTDTEPSEIEILDSSGPIRGSEMFTSVPIKQEPNDSVSTPPPPPPPNNEKFY